MKQHAVGHVYIWEGGSLWIGKSNGATGMHRHHAIQISLALDGSFGLRTSDSPRWRTYREAIVASHQLHAFRTSEGVVATTFVEPEAREGRILMERLGNDVITEIPQPLAARASAVLRDAYSGRAQEERMVAAAHSAIGILTDGAEPMRVIDARILSAIEVIRNRLAGPLRQEEIAEAVFLSPSRFRHLFVEETGMTFRPYVLWLRLHRALERYAAGESLSNAAIDAGFSDLAHLSRTFRRMFGVAPSMLEQARTYVPIVSRRD